MPSKDDGPVAILAGGGRLPRQLIDHRTSQGCPFKLLAFRGFAARDVRARADATLHLLDLQGILAQLQAWKPASVTLAGGVHRPSATALLSAYSLFMNFQKVRSVISKGDDNLLRGAVSLLEEWGQRVVGVHELMPGLTASAGVLGQHAPNDEDRQVMTAGFEVLRALSPYDVGQAVAMSGERVLAIEGPEGTDRMLKRAKAVQRRFLLSRSSLRGAIIKAAKRGQDLRVDMPAIGPRTVQEAHKAGLHGVAVGAGSTLIVDKEKTIETANRLGLYLIGMVPPWEKAGADEVRLGHGA